MALTSSKKKETNTYVVEFTLDKAAFDDEVSKAFKKNSGKLSVPGFRKGKAPRSVIEKMYGKGVFYNDAIDALLPEAYGEAIKEAKLDVVDQPEIELEGINDDGVALKATVTVKPTVKVSEYKGLTAERREVVVTDEEVDKEIEAARNRNARVLTVSDRAAELGDEVIIDFEGFLDGVAFDGGKGEKQSLKLGSNTFIPGFEDQIVGHNTGDAFDITVTFPEDYGEASLAGKQTVFKIVLHEIKKTELPELDDEFVKDVSEFNTVDEYKADVKAKIEERKNRSADNDVEAQLMDKLVENTSGEIPECMVNREVDDRVNEFKYRLESQGLDIKTYYQYVGGDENKLRESYHDDAAKQVRMRLGLERVAKTEKLKAGKKELEEEYSKLATQYGMDVDAIKKAVSEDTISEEIINRKAVALIKENAVITTKVEEKKAD